VAGTLILLQQAGYEIHYCNLANGCCGSMVLPRAEIAAIRRREAMAACARIGAVFHESFCDDLEIFYEKPLLAKVAAVVRDVAPEILLTHSPSDYMEDHMNACRLAVTAAFVRGMPNYVSDPPRPIVTQEVTVYHAQPHGNRDPLRLPIEPDLFVDISSVIELKIAMLAEHQSQKRWLDETQGMGSYLDACRELSRELGRKSGRFEYAEGWRRHLHLGFCGPDSDPLARVLSGKILMAGRD
jgi:LmbE family N-acetylglucosaminyl deacetylase